MLREFCVVCLVLPLGCASTAGSSSYGSLQAEYDRSRSSEDRSGADAREPPIFVAAPPSEGGQATSVAGPPGRESAASSTLERSAFVRAVLRENPSVESARQGWRAALARVRGTGGLEDPMIDLGFAPLSIGSSHSRFGYEVGISQKLPWFGKRSFEADAAAAEAAAAKLDFEGMRRELALTAIDLYDQYYVAVKSLEINARHLELMRALRSGVASQFESGRAGAQDLLQAESEMTKLEYDTAVLSAQRDVVTAQMNELLHRDPSAPLPPPPSELPLPPAPDVRDPKRLQDAAVSGRPDIQALHERARAQQALGERAGREAYPDVTVSTSYSSMWDMAEHRWMVGLGFPLPIQTGARSGMKEESVAMRAQYESDARRLADSARTQVYVSLKRLEESRHLLRLFDERLLPVARDRIEAARASFTASRGPFTAVMEAERGLRMVELDHQMARAEYDRRHAELERAIGRVPGIGEGERADGR